MAQSRFRVGGAYTRLTWVNSTATAAAGGSSTATNGTAGTTLAYVDVIRETAPRAVATPQAIQPLDSEYPVEIAFPGALEAGSLEVTFREQWNAEVWEAFYQTYTDYQTGTGVVTPISDLLGVFKAQLANTGTITLQKVIIDPTTGAAVRTITYNNPTIVNVMIDETVNIGQMTFPKSVQFMYTSRTEQYSSAVGTLKGDNLKVTNPGSQLASPVFLSNGTY